MTSAQLPGITVERTPMAFVLVRFHRLFGVYYVPATCLRADIAVGGLVLCECHHGEAAGVVVKDVSEQVIEYARLAPEESEPAGGRTLEWIEERCVAELQQGSPLFNLTSRSGMPTDFQMLRFPRVLRRGVNKDKKKMYYARWRDREMLPLVQRLIAERGLECRFTVEEVEYQVDFRSITLYIQEHAVDPQWGQLDYTLLGDVLTGPLRTDRVEFRLTDRRDQLHITGHLLEPSMNASLMELLNSVRDYPPPFGVTPQPTRSMAEGKSVFMMQHLMANSMMDDMQSSAASNFSGTGANPSPMTMYAAPQTTQGVRFTGAPITYIPGSTHATYHADAASGQMTYVQPMMQQPSYTLVQTPPQPTILPQNIAYAPNTTASLNNMCIFLPPGAQAGNTPNVAFTAPQQPSMPLQLLTATNGMQYVPTYVNGTVSSAAPPMVPQPTYAPTQMFVQAPAQLPPGYPYNVGYLPQ